MTTKNTRGPGRPRTLLAVPCDTHGDAPCPNPGGCVNRCERAGLPIVRLPGKREARRLAASLAAGWIRASLNAGAELTERDGSTLDPESRDYGRVRDALDELLTELDARC